MWLPNIHAAKPADLLQAILFDLSLPYEGLGEQELRLAVTAQLLQSLQDGRPTVLVIDEAQHLNAAALEELRLLGNLESRQGKGLFVVLVAQPTLRDALAAGLRGVRPTADDPLRATAPHRGREPRLHRPSRRPCGRIG